MFLFYCSVSGLEMETISSPKNKFIMERGAGSINFDHDQFLVEDLLDENSLAGFYGPSGSENRSL